ncbi:hypothetical protein A4X03_0g7472 [Tilletia caries]|uniref:Uncharacterized protein n=1 Tax=Tilletia caries TaxID=13290 RepID=A0A8T8SQA8_9BASI|nr:hypothetical protein A4X03_0g7472 [Tilletia caries]
MTLSSQQPPDNSQLPGEAASLSQEIAALSPAGSLSANRIQRPPPETYSEQNNDDADYEDTSDNDDDSNLPSASTSNPSSQNTAGVQSTAAATLSTATTTSLPPQPPLPDRTRLALLARSSASCSDDEEAVAIFQNSFARATDVFVIEAWTIHKRLASGSLRFKNEIVALLTKEEYGVPRNFRTPGRTSAEIPGPLRAFRITGK